MAAKRFVDYTITVRATAEVDADSDEEAVAKLHTLGFDKLIEDIHDIVEIVPDSIRVEKEDE